MKRTLLVDTNRAAVPLYRALCDLGHEVWVVGGKPTEPLSRLAANYMELDYSDTERLAAFVDEKRFDYLVPGCTDVSYAACAEINHGRFPGMDTSVDTLTINSKREFRELAGNLGLSIPRVLSPEQAAAAEAVVVKPVDSFSGRGMTVLEDPVPHALNKALADAREASKTGCAMVEEFVSGQLFSHSAFVRNGDVIADFVVQEDCTTNRFTVDTSRMAPEFPGGMLESLRKDLLRVITSLQLTNGLMHTQFIASGDRYWIIEMTRRCPGDLYSLLVEYSTGYPYAASYVAPFVEEVPRPRDAANCQARITRHTVTSREGGSLWGFRFAMPVEIRLFVPLATTGEFIGPSPYGRAGIFFFSSPSKHEQDDLYRRLLNGELYSFS